MAGGAVTRWTAAGRGALTFLLAAWAAVDAAAAESRRGDRSYVHLQDDMFAGYTVDELRAGAVYDEEGDLLATVQDLVINGNEELTGVVLEVAGPLGLGFDVDVEIVPLRLQRGQDGRLYTGLTKEAIESVPAVARRNGRWHILR